MLFAAPHRHFTSIFAAVGRFLRQLGIGITCANNLMVLPMIFINQAMFDMDVASTSGVSKPCFTKPVGGCRSGMGAALQFFTRFSAVFNRALTIGTSWVKSTSFVFTSVVPVVFSSQALLVDEVGCKIFCDRSVVSSPVGGSTVGQRPALFVTMVTVAAKILHPTSSTSRA